MKKFATLAMVLGMIVGATGCTTSELNEAFNYGVKKVDCTATFKTMTYGDNYPVQIDKIRTNHVGQQFAPIKPNLYLKFYGPWQSLDLFKNIQCTKGDTNPPANVVDAKS